MGQIFCSSIYFNTHMSLSIPTVAACRSSLTLNGLQCRFVDALKQIKELFARCSNQSRITRKYAHDQTRTKISSQGLSHLSRCEPLHEVKRVVPLLISIVGD